jgi:hypothetical protein
VKLSALMLVIAFAGVVGGAYLISPVAVGAAVVFDSLVLGALALLRDVPAPVERPQRLSRLTRSDRPGRGREAA